VFSLRLPQSSTDIQPSPFVEVSLLRGLFFLCVSRESLHVLSMPGGLFLRCMYTFSFVKKGWLLVIVCTLKPFPLAWSAECGVHCRGTNGAGTRNHVLIDGVFPSVLPRFGDAERPSFMMKVSGLTGLRFFSPVERRTCFFFFLRFFIFQLPSFRFRLTVLNEVLTSDSRLQASGFPC